MQDEYEILRQVFGYDEFRPGQKVLVDSILNGRDTLGIMPTGAGKSICYQVPALCMEGMTIVVSPLISLMKDQVNSLVQAGVAAAYLNSSLTPGQQHTVLARAAQGRYKIMYVAPERLATESFLNWACHAPIDMVTVDEAHCISQWGQDFRPSYLGITEFVQALPQRPIVTAFTATATGQVKEDIIHILNLQEPEVLVTGFDRPNLYFEVRRPGNKRTALLEAVEEQGSSSGIVYCATRKGVEEVCELLQGRGFRATRYHAGLEPEERQKNQDDFLFDRCPVMVATNAFGMGIDKSNVSYVIHYNMPKNIEGYYQEAGRAGRDGSPARCILLYSGQDVRIQQMLIDRSDEESAETDPKIKEQIRQLNLERLRQMTFYCTTADCLRAFLLRYFGENAPAHCDRCGNCLEAPKGDLSAQARAALGLVQELAERRRAYGKSMLAAILKGEDEERLREKRLNDAQGFGALRSLTLPQIRALLDQLEQQNCLEVETGEYPVMILGPEAKDVLAGRGFQGRLPEGRPGRKAKEAREARMAMDGEGDPALVERLRELRSRLAGEKNVPAYVIFPDSALVEMSVRRPTDMESFLQVKGVGEAKARKYCEPFTRVVREYLEEFGAHSGMHLSSRSTVQAGVRPLRKPGSGREAPALQAQASTAREPEETGLLEQLRLEASGGLPLPIMAKNHKMTLHELCVELAKIRW